ncbi:MAG TPA: DUF3301 domain-containing protein [Casimicrobiaceae bacterium]|nr:DUF3301 domain-containing protein [Casimicrobiaceae bacterium]
MLQAFVPVILILLGFYFWHAALKAREQARAIGHELCARARVQLLDQSVALNRLRLARGRDGRLHWQRRYRFELSTDGVDRHHGTLEIVDGELAAHSLPFAADDAARSNVVEFRARIH